MAKQSWDKTRANPGPSLTPQETRLLSQLRQPPPIASCLEGLLKLADASESPPRSADRLEASRVTAVRQLGQTTLHE